MTCDTKLRGANSATKTVNGIAYISPYVNEMVGTWRGGGIRIDITLHNSMKCLQ